MILLTEDTWSIKNTHTKGKGIFAEKDIAAGVVIGDYLGKVIKTAEEDTSEKDGLYLLYYHDYASLYPEDLQKPGIHLMNHSCAPNCWLTIYKGHTLFFSLRKIFAGEELTVSYQLSPADFCDPCLHQCYCQTRHCTGTMHLHKDAFARWTRFSENEAKKTKRARIRYGKVLPKLKEYPANIPDHPIYSLYANAQIASRELQSDKLPAAPAIRKLIREYGQPLYFPLLNKTIIGVVNETLIMRI